LVAVVVFLASLVIPFLELLGPFPLVVTTRLVIAAIVAGTLVYNRLQEFGPTITIKFRDGSGVKADQTEIRYRGVPVGQVTTVELSPDHEHVVMTARPRHSAAGLAKEGALFWIVRPEVGFGTVRGLNFGLFRGLRVNVESLRSLVAGGIAFATPDDAGGPVKDGALFLLHEKPQPEWLDWLPKIPIAPAG
jgi:paraquat-inducible protein B